MSDVLVGRDLYYRQTDDKGKSFVNCTRVWDENLFIEARKSEAAKSKKENKKSKAAFEKITKDQYHEAKSSV